MNAGCGDKIEFDDVEYQARYAVAGVNETVSEDPSEEVGVLVVDESRYSDDGYDTYPDDEYERDECEKPEGSDDEDEGVVSDFGSDSDDGSDAEEEEGGDDDDDDDKDL